MDDHGYDDSLHPPSEVHIAADHLGGEGRMSSPIPDSPLSSAPNSAPSSPGHQHPSLHGYTGDLDEVYEDNFKSLNDGFNHAGGLLDDNVYLPQLDHEKPHRMETDPGDIPIFSVVPPSKSDAPFDEAGLEASAPTASAGAGPVVLSPTPVRSKPKNALWMRKNHHNNDDDDDYDDGNDDLKSPRDLRSSPVSPLQRRLLKNRRRSEEMKLNNSNISSSSINSITGGGSQHQHLNSPSTISVRQPDPRKSKADIVHQAKQVMARRSSATLPFEDEDVANVDSNTKNDIDDDEIPDDERRAATGSINTSSSASHLFPGKLSNPTTINSGSGIVLPLSAPDEQREAPMDEPPLSPVRSLAASDCDRVDDLQQQAPSMDEARPIRLYGTAAATTSSKSFDHDDDEQQQQHPYLDSSFVSRHTVEHRPKAIVSITKTNTTTPTETALTPARAVRSGLRVTTTDAVLEENGIDNDCGGFETYIVPSDPGSPFSEQQSAVGTVDESFYSSDGSLEKNRNEEIEISFSENDEDDQDIFTDGDDEDDPLSGILDPVQYPRMAAKALLGAQSDFTNFFMGRKGMEEEVAKLIQEPPFRRTESEPTGGQVASKSQPTGDQNVSKSEPTGGQVASKSRPIGSQSAQVVRTKSEPTATGGQIVSTNLLARGTYQDRANVAVAAAAAAAYNSDNDTGFGWVDDLVHESVGFVGKLTVTDAFRSFKTVAVSDQIQSGVCTPPNFAASTTVSSNGMRRIEQGSTSKHEQRSTSKEEQGSTSKQEKGSTSKQKPGTSRSSGSSGSVAPKSVRRIEQGSSLKGNPATSFSSVSSESSVADDDSKTRQSRGQILDDLVAKSMEEAATMHGASPVKSPVKKNGKDGVWWLELELSKREGVKQAGGPSGAAEKIITIGNRDDKLQKAAGSQAENNPSIRSPSKESQSKDSQQGRSKPSKFWQGVRAKRSKDYNEMMSDEEEHVDEGSGMDSIAKYGTNSTVESPLPVPEEPPSLRRSNNTFDAELSFDGVPPTAKDDEPLFLRPFSGNALSRINSVQSSTAPGNEPPSISPSTSFSPSTGTDDQRLASKLLRQSGSGENTALTPGGGDDDDDDASHHSMDILMNSLDKMVNSLEAMTPSHLRECAKSKDVEDVESPQETSSTTKQRVRPDPDAISNGSPLEYVSTKSQRVGADPDALSNGKLILVESIDNDFGVPIGDTMISLLNEDTDVSWASRVHEAIWRGRTMRRHFDSKYFLGKHDHKPSNPSAGRTSVPVDVDDARMIGGVGSVSTTQGAAREHLKYDDFDDALMLYENIIFSYYRFFDEVLKKSEVELSKQNMTGKVSDFKPYIGAALHNIGMIHLLKGDHGAAFTHFERAVLNRAACLDNGHVDYVTSLVKMATCQYALEDFSRAHSNLEEALSLSGHYTETVLDYRQLAEILNNLGCLSYMGGKPDKAKRLFQESLQAQAAAADDSLYTGTQFSCYSASLNMSIARGNVGFIALVTRDIPASTAALELAVKEQQLLLRDAHVTLISTMDHLVVTNLLSGRLQKALQMLQRMLQMQIDAFGPSDMRCLRTANKIENLQNQERESAKSAKGDESPESDNDGNTGKKTKKKRVLNAFKSIIKKK